VAGRYATALFEIAREANNLEQVEADLGKITAAMDISADLRDLISSPVYSRAEQGRAVTGLAGKLELGAAVANTLSLMAQKHRLQAIPAVIATVHALAADARGEVRAEVTAAKALTKTQTEQLAKALKASVGKDVEIDLSVDENIIGGLIVKMGSKMIDMSVASKLANLQNAMKEVG